MTSAYGSDLKQDRVQREDGCIQGAQTTLWRACATGTPGVALPWKACDANI
jgi:hypothetical protein